MLNVLLWICPFSVQMLKIEGNNSKSTCFLTCDYQLGCEVVPSSEVRCPRRRIKA